MSIDRLTFDCLYSIVLYLDDYDIFKLLQINKYFSELKQKESFWRRLWYSRYKFNDMYDELSVYQNFMRCVLTRKFLELCKLYFYFGSIDLIIHSNTPKRILNRALFIPMIGYKLDSIKNICNTLINALKIVNINLINYSPDIHDNSINFANYLLNQINCCSNQKKVTLWLFVKMNIT